MRAEYARQGNFRSFLIGSGVIAGCLWTLIAGKVGAVEPQAWVGEVSLTLDGGGSDQGSISDDNKFTSWSYSETLSGIVPSDSSIQVHSSPPYVCSSTQSLGRRSREPVSRLTAAAASTTPQPQAKSGP